MNKRKKPSNNGPTKSDQSAKSGNNLESKDKKVEDKHKDHDSRKKKSLGEKFQSIGKYVATFTAIGGLIVIGYNYYVDIFIAWPIEEQGDEYFNEGLYDKAEEEYEKALNKKVLFKTGLEGKIAKAQLITGISEESRLYDEYYLRVGTKTPEILRNCESYEAAYGKDPFIFFIKISTLLGLGDKDELKKILSSIQTLKLDDRTRGAVHKARLYLAKTKSEREAILEEARISIPDIPNVSYFSAISYGVLLFKARKYDEGIEYFDELQKVLKYRSEVLTNFAQLYIKKGRKLIANDLELSIEQFTLAKEIAQYAISLNEKDFTSWGILGECYEYLEDEQGALNAYEKSFDIFSDYIPAKINYGFILFDQAKQFGDSVYWSEAVAHYENIKDDPPKDHQWWCIIRGNLAAVYGENSVYGTNQTRNPSFSYTKSLKFYYEACKSCPNRAPIAERFITKFIEAVCDEKFDEDSLLRSLRISIDSIVSIGKNALQRGPENIEILKNLFKLLLVTDRLAVARELIEEQNQYLNYGQQIELERLLTIANTNPSNVCEEVN